MENTHNDGDKKPTDLLRRLVAGDLVDLDNDDGSHEETVLLRGTHLSRLLARYVNGEITQEYLEDWSNLIDKSERIVYEEKNKSLIEEILYIFAHPEEGKLSKTMIEAYFRVL